MSSGTIKVWDVATRIFHWSLAISFAGAFATAESERLRDVHVVLGYTVAGLVAFRLLWGLVGPRYARFSSFAYGPRAVAGYLKSLLGPRPQHYVGHNPAGGWAVFALLGLAALSVLTGYATYNDIGGDVLEELHEGLTHTMLALVVVHVAAVILSSFLHRENLVRAMVTGRKRP